MMSTITLIYFKLAELISTLVPSSNGMLNQFAINMVNLSNATDPALIINLIADLVFALILLFIFMPIYILWRIFMTLIGQPVPVPWF